MLIDSWANVTGKEGYRRARKGGGEEEECMLANMDASGEQIKKKKISLATVSKRKTHHNMFFQV